MIIIYVLAAMFSAGILAGSFFFIRMIWDDFGPIGTAICVGIGLPISLGMAIFPWGIIASESSPDLVTLKKGAWECSAAHTETTMIMAGKVLVPSTHSVCDQYGRAQ